MKHNPLRDGVKTLEDVKVVERYFFFAICIAPIFEILIWVLVVLGVRTFAVNLAALWGIFVLFVYSVLYKHIQTNLSLALTIFTGLMFWWVRLLQDYLAGKGILQMALNFVPLLMLPTFVKLYGRMIEAREFRQRSQSSSSSSSSS